MVVVVVMLNLLVSLLNDLYEELKHLATADWCREQVSRKYQEGNEDGKLASSAREKDDPHHSLAEGGLPQLREPHTLLSVPQEFVATRQKQFPTLC